MNARRAVPAGLMRAIKRRLVPPNVVIDPGPELLEMGAGSYGAPQIITFDSSPAKVTMGNFCSIHETVQIITGGYHRVDWVSTFPFRIRLGIPGSVKRGRFSNRSSRETRPRAQAQAGFAA
jgi:hypothetical protein